MREALTLTEGSDEAYKYQRFVSKTQKTKTSPELLLLLCHSHLTEFGLFCTITEQFKPDEIKILTKAFKKIQSETKMTGQCVCRVQGYI